MQAFAERGALPRGRRLKDLCRKGIPPEKRPRVWFVLSGAQEAKRAAGPGAYAALLARPSIPAEAEWARQIELARVHLASPVPPPPPLAAADAPYRRREQDVPRTFPEQPWLRSARGAAALRSLLTAYARHAPGVGYCQSLNYVAAFVLLHMPEPEQEEHAFWLFARLVDGVLGADCYGPDLGGLRVTQQALGRLLASKLPRLAGHLAALGGDVGLLSTEWLLCAFVLTLPADTAARVWDSLLLEGPKVLLRVALALLSRAQDALLAADNLGELMQAAQRHARSSHDADALLHTAFYGVGGMPHRLIAAYRMFGRRELAHERAERERRRGAQGPRDTKRQAGSWRGALLGLL